MSLDDLYRYEHCMMRSSGGSWPLAVLVVDCVPTMDGGDRPYAVAEPKLSRWNAILLTLKDGNYLRSREAAGRGEKGFWSLVSELAEHTRYCFILSSGCGPAWSMLGVWKRLENGTILLSKEEVRYAAPEKAAVPSVRPDCAGASGVLPGGILRRVSNSQNGYVVLEGGCKILSFTPAGTGCRMKWVDTSNYGVDVCKNVAPGADRCYAVAEFLVQSKEMLDGAGLAPLQGTAGSTAMKGFRKFHLEGGLFVHENQACLALEALSFCGGRCEAFRLGAIEESVWHLDFRSLYPGVAINLPLPVRLDRFLDRVPVGWDWRDADPRRCIAAVVLRTTAPRFPCRLKGDVVWPVGRFHATLAGPELAEAVAHNLIESVQQVAVYECEPVLSPFMTRLYWERCHREQSGQRTAAALAKSLMVSLVGKFGQRAYGWENMPNEEADRPWCYWWGGGPDGTPCRWRSVGGNVQREVCHGFAPDSCPAIAAFVTSAGRMRLWRAMVCAGRENVFYCDTDSLMVNRKGRSNLQTRRWIRPGELGWLYEKAGPVSLEVRGIKYYLQNGSVVCAGMPPEVVTDPSDPTDYDRSRSPVEAIRKGEIPVHKVTRGSYVRHEVYRHGQVGPDGRVRPIKLGEE